MAGARPRSGPANSCRGVLRWYGRKAVMSNAKRVAQRSKLAEIAALNLMALKLDLSQYGPQVVRSDNNELVIYLLHKPNVIHMEIDGCMDLFGTIVNLRFHGRSICERQLGIKNETALHYRGFSSPHFLIEIARNYRSGY